jgi:hypothetical protein
MRNSRKWIADARPTLGRILMAFVLVMVMGGISMAPPAFARDHRGRHEHWRHHQHWRPYGYYYGYPYEPYGYYYYPAPAYPPPAVYAPYPSPGISFVFPVHIR